MNRTTHPVEPEELMAYLDGELKAERGLDIAVHLEECAECRALAAELRDLSTQLADWQVELAPQRIDVAINAAIDQKGRENLAAGLAKVTEEKPRRSRLWRWAWAATGSVAFVLLLAAIAIPNLLRSRMATNQGAYKIVSIVPETEFNKRASRSEAGGGGGGNGGKLHVPNEPVGPMVIRTASLVLVAKDVDAARGAIELLVRQHQGYLAQLNTSGGDPASHVFAATLRVPADRLDAVLGELKKLGQTKEESQSGEEVTQRYVDLVARLSNARNTEQRLVQILQQRTGKVSEVLEVEREIARVREEIEEMDAQRKTLEKQVQFATLQVRVEQEYHAQLNLPPTSVGSRLRNAAIEGLQGAAQSAVALALFLLGNGPSILFWGLLLVWPVRFAWRRLRPKES